MVSHTGNVSFTILPYVWDHWKRRGCGNALHFPDKEIQHQNDLWRTDQDLAKNLQQRTDLRRLIVWIRLGHNGCLSRSLVRANRNGCYCHRCYAFERHSGNLGIWIFPRKITALTVASAPVASAPLASAPLSHRQYGSLSRWLRLRSATVNRRCRNRSHI